jgi:hypothetical protein
MSKLFSLLPGWPEVLLALAFVGGVAAAVLGYGHSRFKAGQAEVQVRWDAQKQEAQAVAIRQEAQNQMTTVLRQGKVKEVIHEKEDKLAAAIVDAGGARAAGQRLRAAATRYAAGACAPPKGAAPASASAPASAPADVLADVLSRIDGTAGELAQALDESRLAGLACERIHDASLTVAPAP